MVNVAGHDPSCYCVDCRSIRTAHQNAAQERALSAMPTILTGGEKAAIDQSPMAFALVLMENRVPVVVIRNKLVQGLPEATEDEVDDLLGVVDEIHREDKHAKGVSRILKGVALTLLGLGISIPLWLFLGFLVFLGIVLTLTGLVQLTIGICEVKDSQETGNAAQRQRAG